MNAFVRSYLQWCFWFAAFIAARVTGRWVRCWRCFIRCHRRSGCRCIQWLRQPNRMFLFMFIGRRLVWVSWFIRIRWTIFRWRRNGRLWWWTVATSWQRFCTSYGNSWSEWGRFSYGRHCIQQHTFAPNEWMAVLHSTCFIHNRLSQCHWSESHFYAENRRRK